ncbi:TetR/AcrR family transcriptional regulator C-terminal ligand-binding domain-containing protein [soil metagenome]
MTDRRSPEVDGRIEATALTILRSRGPLAVTIESVAAESGVAKTTIYRRFDNRDDLLRAVISSATRVVAVPDGLTAYETMHWYLSEALETIEYVVGRGAVAAIIVNDDPKFTAMLLEMIRMRSKPLRENLRERAANGELTPDLDIELLISVLLGTFVAESIRGRISEQNWADEVLALLWPAFAPERARPARAASGR